MSAPVPPFDGTQVCAQVDVEVFHPEKGGSTAAAKALCATCPLALPCLEYALAIEGPHGPHHGVWGRTSAQERQAIARARLFAQNRGGDRLERPSRGDVVRPAQSGSAAA